MRRLAKGVAPVPTIASRTTLRSSVRTVAKGLM